MTMPRRGREFKCERLRDGLTGSTWEQTNLEIGSFELLLPLHETGSAELFLSFFSSASSLSRIGWHTNADASLASPPQSTNCVHRCSAGLEHQTQLLR